MDDIQQLTRDYKRHEDAKNMAKAVDDFYSCYENCVVCSDLARELSIKELDKTKSDNFKKLADEQEKEANLYLGKLRLSPSEIFKMKKRKLPKSFDKFIGEDTLKKYLSENLIPYWRDHKMNQREKSAILFYGPEGGSKSVFIQTLIHELNATPYYLNPLNNYSPFGDNTKAQIEHLFKLAEEKDNVVFYFTKPVCYFPQEQSKVNKATSKLFLKLIKKEIKRVKKLNLNILFVASTACPDKMNPKAFSKGLFDELLRIHHPDRYVRKALMEDRLKGIEFEDKDAIDKLTPITHGFIIKEVSRLCKRIHYVSELYIKDGKSGVITNDMLDRMLKEFGPQDDIGFQSTVDAFEKSLSSDITIINDDIVEIK